MQELFCCIICLDYWIANRSKDSIHLRFCFIESVDEAKYQTRMVQHVAFLPLLPFVQPMRHFLRKACRLRRWCLVIGRKGAWRSRHSPDWPAHLQQAYSTSNIVPRKVALEFQHALFIGLPNPRWSLKFEGALFEPA